MDTRLRIKCAHCRGPAYMTDWRPKRGLDPILREFRCKYRRRVTYASEPPGSYTTKAHGYQKTPLALSPNRKEKNQKNR